MIQTGTVTKIEGSRVWALVRPEGGTCADCSCEKPTRTLEARLQGQDPISTGDQVILESSRLFAGLAAFILAALALGGAVLGWNFAGQSAGETGQAIAALGGTAAGLLLAVVLSTPLRRAQLPVAKAVSVRLHQPDQDA